LETATRNVKNLRALLGITIEKRGTWVSSCKVFTRLQSIYRDREKKRLIAILPYINTLRL